MSSSDYLDARPWRLSSAGPGIELSRHESLIAAIQHQRAVSGVSESWAKTDGLRWVSTRGHLIERLGA